MKPKQRILVFEHTQLNIGDQGFTRQHWEKLGWYNNRHEGKYFTLTPKGIKFQQYVGVIQVGNLVIEILPKVNRDTGDDSKRQWQQVLIDMLRVCHRLKIDSHDKAAVKIKNNSILDTYLELFLQECEAIARKGLVKKYRTVQQNCTSLKGKLLFPKQLQKNLIHQERFFTQYQHFDRDNVFNQILHQALLLIPALSDQRMLKDRVADLLLLFPELSPLKITAATFQHLTYDRKTSDYKPAMEIAAMLLLNYRPDICGGHHHLLAILFDMNTLWEEYIFRQLQKHKPDGYTVISYSSRKFWESEKHPVSRKIEPDIVITDDQDRSFILDTKWKLIPGHGPADADLKQMYVYNDYWQSKMAILIYPQPDHSAGMEYHAGSFSEQGGQPARHGCSILKVSVLNEFHKLDRQLGQWIHEQLMAVL
ncbi:McrC family protein [Chitinophaga sp. Hz27]|uniref:McrC family protein n=1 Tax=Chitinophaga sp. Hz27 TaxID=3347169 RepID=UPI0035DF751C